MIEFRLAKSFERSPVKLSSETCRLHYNHDIKTVKENIHITMDFLVQEI